MKRLYFAAIMAIVGQTTFTENTNYPLIGRSENNDEAVESTKQKPNQAVVFTIDTNKDEFRKSLPIDPSEFEKTSLVNFLERDYRPRYEFETPKDAENRRAIIWLASWFFTPLYEYKIQGNLADLDTSIQTTGSVSMDLINKQVKIIRKTKKRDNDFASKFVMSNQKTPCVYCPQIERFQYDEDAHIAKYQYDGSAIIIGTQNTSLCEQFKSHIAEENSKRAKYFSSPEYAQSQIRKDEYKKIKEELKQLAKNLAKNNVKES